VRRFVAAVGLADRNLEGGALEEGVSLNACRRNNSTKSSSGIETCLLNFQWFIAENFKFVGVTTPLYKNELSHHVYY